MSRGMGRIQRAALTYLRTNPEAIPGAGVPLHDVTCAVYSTTEPTDAQRTSVRRAIAGLIKAGLAGSYRRSFRDKMGPGCRFYRQRRHGPNGTVTSHTVALSETHVFLLPRGHRPAPEL